jgi:hypothetical protein
VSRFGRNHDSFDGLDEGQTTASSTADSSASLQMTREQATSKKQPQIPPLRCGMATKKQ